MEARGDEIAGSVLVRDFCKACDEPIRVCPSDLEKDNYCAACWLEKPVTTNPAVKEVHNVHQKRKPYRTGEELEEEDVRSRFAPRPFGGYWCSN